MRVMAMRVCILGAGGLGSLIGGGLAESGVHVTLVGRPDHVEAIRSGGLVISGISGERTVLDGLEAVARAEEARGPYDALVLGVKAKDTETALAGASGLRGDVALVFSLQNTIAKDEALASWIGQERVVGASTTEAGFLDGAGRIRHVATAPTAFYFGELDGTTSERVAALVDVFSKAGFPAKQTPHIQHVEWEKLLQAAVLAAWSVSTMGMMPDRSVAEALIVPDAAEHYVAIAQELIRVYRGLGYEPQDFFHPYSRFREFSKWSFDEAVAGMRAQGQRMLDIGATGRPSLHLDLMRGRPTEVEYVLAPFLEAADRLEIPVPTVRAAYRIIRTLETMHT